MIKKLIDSDCIKKGKFTLKCGELSKYYFDMKNLISYPSLLKEIGDAIYKNLDDFDIICGIPYGGLPIASYISTTYNKPLIFIRDNQKSYGTCNKIEGQYNRSDRCVLIDDVITTGKSIQEAINYLTDKISIVKCVVIFDRQNNYDCSMPVWSLLNKTDLIKYRLKEIQQKKQSRVCFSADLSDHREILSIIEKIGDKIVICKIHYDIIKEHSKDYFKSRLIALSLKHDFLIMEDRKFNDISYIVNKQYKSFENWVDLVTVHTLVSPEVVRNLSGVMLVSTMSNNSYDFSKHAICLAEANKDRVVGFITQKRIGSGDLVCMTPGICINVNKSNNSINDQNYRTVEDVDTDFYIIGRALYNSPNLESDADKIVSASVKN